MPFYEYECSSCKFYVEVLQKISDDPLRKCPSCKKQSMKKLVSAPVFRLKGAGWYETDFKSEGEDKRNIADRDEPAEDPKPAADVKADAAPDKPAESRPEVNTGSGDKKAAAKAESRGERQADRKGKPKAAPVKPAAKPAKPAKPSRPVAKKAPAKKKAKRR